ncbi:hypothetical protein DEIPH_ctg013orf0003 [Deinococcus phoenicis]|uniref:Uncharacterized protein n=2 Tax=Deinococcus phoenicis TaxID=1476583 RepID=A0A016QSD0_9DEIO|nr:hypothetical protein DEIPH_ctg013orf0003 [Deinococcus phoenicis]
MVPLAYVEGVAAHVSLFNRDVQLYKDVVERPYRFQPQLLDHGTRVKVFNEGVCRGFLEAEEDSLPLPEAAVKVIRALQREGSLSRRLQMTITEQDGQQVAEITIGMPPILFRSRSYCDRLYEAVEGTSTEEFLITLKIVPQDMQRGPIPGVAP